MLSEVEPPDAPPIANALRAITASSDAARQEAQSMGVGALSQALLGCPEVEGRRAIALALSALLDGNWTRAYEAAGWPTLLATLHLASVSSSSADGSEVELAVVHADALRGATSLLVGSAASRDSLAADPNALRFLSHCLTSYLIANPASVNDEPAFARGAAYSLVASLNSPHKELVVEGTSALLKLVDVSGMIAPLVEAGAAPALVKLLSSADTLTAMPLGKALGAMINTSESVRKSVLDAGGAAAVGKALLTLQSSGAAMHAEGRLALALTLANLVKDDYAAVKDSVGWGALVAALAAAASQTSPAMQQLADATAPPLIAAVDDLYKPRPIGSSAPVAGSTSGIAAKFSFDHEEPPPKPKATATTVPGLKRPGGANYELD